MLMIGQETAMGVVGWWVVGEIGCQYLVHYWHFQTSVAIKLGNSTSEINHIQRIVVFRRNEC